MTNHNRTAGSQQNLVDDDPTRITVWYCCMCAQYHGDPPNRYDCLRCKHMMCPYCLKQRAGDKISVNTPSTHLPSPLEHQDYEYSYGAGYFAYYTDHYRAHDAAAALIANYTNTATTTTTSNDINGPMQYMLTSGSSSLSVNTDSGSENQSSIRDFSPIPSPLNTHSQLTQGSRTNINPSINRSRRRSEIHHNLENEESTKDPAIFSGMIQI